MEDEDMKEETAESDGDAPLIAYKLLKSLGANAEGDVVHLPNSVGSTLCEAGHCELAKEEDMNQEVEDTENDEEYEDQPMVANAVDKLTRKIETKAAEAVAKAMPTSRQASSVPATVAQPIYKSNGAYLADIVRAVGNDDRSTTTWNRINAWQTKAADAWTKMGITTKAILGINETTSSSGGFLVNPEFSQDVYKNPHTQINLQDQMPAIEAKSNIMNYRYVAESSLANGSIYGGLNMVATAEGASFTSSLPTWANSVFQLHKFAIFVYYTSEVLQDSSYPIERELDEYCKRAFIYGLNQQIVQGTTMEGLLNCPGLVTVTHSSNDTAWSTTPSTSLTYADLAAIWAAVYPDSQTSTCANDLYLYGQRSSLGYSI